jgi:HEAT repeat protein
VNNPKEGSWMMSNRDPSPDRVERDRRAVRSAVGRLIRHTADEDPTIVAKAVQALEEIGPFVVGPLIDALPGARSPRHRLAIIGGLMNFGQQAKLPILWALNQVLVHEKDERVRAGAALALKNVIAGRSTESEVAEPEAAASAPSGPARPRSTSPG